MTKYDFVRSAADLYLKSLKHRNIDPEGGYAIEDLMDTLHDSGLYLEKWVIAHIGLPKGERGRNLQCLDGQSSGGQCGDRCHYGCT